jgi:hypothetical protein
MSDVARDFFAQQDEELKKTAQNQVNNAADQLEKSTPIAHPGNYLCEVASFAFHDKKRNNAVRVFPELYMSDSKGSLNLNISLRVIDGTPRVPKGSSIYRNITLFPGKVNGANPTEETIAKVMRFTKPMLVTLTGTNEINLTESWVKEWLTPEFEETSPNKFNLVRDHRMKNKVMVLVDEQLGNDQVVRCVAQRIVKAQPGDKSETFVIAQPAVVAPTTPAPTTSYGNLVEAEDGDVQPHIPEVEEFN